MSADITQDAFLGGALSIRQPKEGYRGGTDPVLLAAACPAQSGDHILDLGCGTGIAALCLLRRVNGTCATGLEINPLHVQLAQANAETNALPLNMILGDISAPPSGFNQTNFDHVIVNPPYFPAGGGTLSRNAGKASALRENVALSVWLDVAVRRCKPKGTVTLIARVDRLVDCIAAVAGRLGGLKILPLTAQISDHAGRFILQGTKNSKAAPTLLPPLIMHDAKGISHAANAVLRCGESIKL